VLVPLSVSVPEPVFVNPPVPEIVPQTAVLVLSPPTVMVCEPRL
jgi:hypothetical protein